MSGEEDSEEAPQLEIVSEVWFNDGNVVLRAGNFIFRVWKSLLSAKSPVFHDMMTFPDSKDQEYLHGCPVATLFDDPADVKYFLRALFHSDFFMPPPSPTEFPIVSGIMKLSHKYQVPYLFRRALSHIDTISPTKIADFQQRHRNRTIPGKSYNVLDLWTLGRETNASWLLPLAGYVTAMKSTELTDSDTDLSIPDLNLLLRAQTKLQIALLPKLWKFLRTLPPHGYTNPYGCNIARIRCIDKLFHNVDSAIFLGWSPKWSTTGLCPVCIETSKPILEADRAVIWDQLPQLFELPSWPELEESRREAMEDVLSGPS